MNAQTFEMAARRIRGALFGLACGDALGAPAEFMPAEQVKSNWGTLKDLVGGGGWAPGEWTDDTAMALAVAEGIYENPDDPVDAIGRRFLEWQKTAKDVGSTVRNALSNYSRYKNWPDASRHTGQAKNGMAAGNGSLMRTLPIALAYPDPDEMLQVSARVSAVTHWDSQAELCCAVYCLWVQNLFAGAEREEAWHLALEVGRKLSEKGQVAPDTAGMRNIPQDFWTRLEGFASKDYDELQPTGYAGYVVDCLEAAVWAVLKSDSLEQALVWLVNLGGEADTMAAVAGGAAGACWGYEAIPARWIEKLYACDRIERAAAGLAAVRWHREAYATPGLPPFNYSEIDDRIVAGRNPLTAFDVRFLKERLHITHILDLREPIEWAAPRLGQEALIEMERLGIQRRNIPITDVSAPTTETLNAACEFISRTVDTPGARLYVHCRAGNERTGSVLTAYYARRDRMTFSKAMVFLRERRGTIGPTPGQESAVRAWLKKR